MRKKRRNRCLAVLLAVAVAAGNMTMVQAQPTDAQSAGVSRQTVEDPESYYNVWWDFEGSIWENIPIGTSVIEPGGTSPATLALADENAENQYMSVKGEGGGKYRVSKLDLNSPALSGAEISFDWKPVSSEETASRFGDIGFFASESPYAYFGLQFDRDLKLHYYTVGEKVNADYSLSYSDETLEGGYQRNSSVDSGTARDTGITADGSTWYTVRLTFDYLSHTASLVIVPRDTPDTILFSESDIPIYGSVQDLASMSVGGWKCAIEMGMDNLGIKYLTDFPPEYYYNVYWNDFEEDIWPSVAIGNDIIAEGGTSPATLTVQQEEQGNQYMYVAGEGGGKYRVSKLDVSNEAASGAEVTFDWMPAAIQDTESRFGDVAFYSTDNTYAYFGLQFDKNFRIHYYTMGENVEQGYGLSYSDEVLEGGYQRNSSVDSGTARDTGITADGSTWYTVKIDFNYDSHTASLTLTERENPEMILFQESDIPIYASAVNVSMISAGAWKAESSMGLDNMGIRYRYSDASTIVAVEQPENVTVLAEKWEEHVAQRPTQAVVTLGDNSTMTLEIGEWTSEPAFDPEVYGTYTWTAPLMVPEGIRNPKNLALTYQMEYVKNFTVEGAYDPTTLEMEFGSVSSVEEFEALRPTETQVVLSNGETAYAALDPDSWTAINNSLPSSYEPDPENHPIPEIPPSFDPEEEGIYIYKVKLADDGEYPLSREIWVEWRVNYFSYDDNFNGHERAMEYLDRGLYAINNVVYDQASGTYVESAQGGIYLSWRILADEYERVSQGQDIVFEIYRNGTKIQSLTNVTNYMDEGGAVGDVYMVKAVQQGIYTYSKEVEALEDNYISVQLQRPLPSYSMTDQLAIYRLNDTEVADVDGDSEYELIVKWYPNNGFDPGKSVSGRTSSPHIIDVYEMDGTALWRLFMGYSSPAGQHFDNFMAYDLDQDGKAELSILTQDGTRTYRPDENGQFAYVTAQEGGYVFQPDDPSNSESAGSYVLSADGSGYVLSNAAGYDFAYVGTKGSPMMDDRYLVDVVGDIEKEGVGILDTGFKSEEVEEYFTVFNGATGEIIDTVDYCYSTRFFMEETTNNKTETVHRFNIGIATIPGDVGDASCTSTIPAVICNRAYYSDMSLVAYTLRDGKIQTAWQTYIPSASQGGGNHNLATGDLDNDGFDEIYMGGTAIDHDGTVLWAKDGFDNMDFMKHGDMIHMTAVFPDSDQLYVFTPVEDSSVSAVANYALSNGSTGARIVAHTFGTGDTGRGMLANVTPDPGYNLWASNPSSDAQGRLTSALYDAYGHVVSDQRPAVQTWSSYWDGDLLSELPDSNPAGGGDKSGLPMGVHKYNWETGETEAIASFAGTLTSNSTKNNPNLIADILGDWREEILVRSADNEELRIYMTNIPTEYTIYTLMQDSVYRNSVANQNTTYNQPTHTSFYLGEDEEGRNRVLNFDLPVYPQRYTTETAQYTDVTFDTDGHVAVEAYTDVLLGSTIQEPDGVSADGYDLEGWYLDAECTERWNFEEDTVEGPMTLYANWTEKAPEEPTTPEESTVPEESTNPEESTVPEESSAPQESGSQGGEEQSPGTGDDSVALIWLFLLSAVALVSMVCLGLTRKKQN